jgi:alpha-beta hydrolase superfamily lysophospholipase
VRVTKIVFIGLGVVMLAAGGGLEVLKRMDWQDPRGGEGGVIEKAMAKYDFDSLRKRGGVAGEIRFLGKIKEVETRRQAVKTASSGGLADFKTEKFKFKSEEKWISGMANIPEVDPGVRLPVIIMIRGYADKPGYYCGSGSWKMADKLAENGFVTFSIDFLGFGESDQESLDMLEARFEKVIGVLDLIETVKNLEYVDKDKMGIWAHSNGGQIAISVLEISGSRMPTVLWAPMTNPFPQSVLDTASDLDDGGRLVIKAIEDFGKSYDVRRYSIENYYQWIDSPVQIHQGTADEWCKVEWQETVVSRLKEEGNEAELIVYKGDDHNLKKNWEVAAERTRNYFFLNLTVE